MAEEIRNAIGLIPDDKKRSYSKAAAQCPELVKTEADPLKFLKYCDGNCWNAAQAIVDYWDEREKLFGERAFLPMVSTGEGAMSIEDVMALNTGHFALLPRTPHGQEVMFVDRNRVLPTSTTVSKLRALFYMLTHLSNAPNAQTLGCHVLVLLVTPRSSELDTHFVRSSVTVLNTLPVKIHLHMLMCMPKFGMTP